MESSYFKVLTLVAASMLVSACTTSLNSTIEPKKASAIREGVPYRLPVAEVDMTITRLLTRCEVVTITFNANKTQITEVKNDKKQYIRVNNVETPTRLIRRLDIDDIKDSTRWAKEEDLRRLGLAAEFKVLVSHEVEYVGGQLLSIDPDEMASTFKTSSLEVEYHENTLQLSKINGSIEGKEAEAAGAAIKLASSVASIAFGLPPIPVPSGGAEDVKAIKGMPTEKLSLCSTSAIDATTAYVSTVKALGAMTTEATNLNTLIEGLKKKKEAGTASSTDLKDLTEAAKKAKKLAAKIKDKTAEKKRLQKILAISNSRSAFKDAKVMTDEKREEVKATYDTALIELANLKAASKKKLGEIAALTKEIDVKNSAFQAAKSGDKKEKLRAELIKYREQRTALYQESKRLTDQIEAATDRKYELQMALAMPSFEDKPTDAKLAEWLENLIPEHKEENVKAGVLKQVTVYAALGPYDDQYVCPGACAAKKSQNSEPEKAGVLNGVIYRIPASSLLLVSTDRPWERIWNVSAARKQKTDLVFKTVRVPQYGPLRSLPLESDWGEKNNLTASFAKSGLPTAISYKRESAPGLAALSSADEAAKAVLSIRDQLDAKEAAAEAAVVAEEQAEIDALARQIDLLEKQQRRDELTLEPDQELVDLQAQLARLQLLASIKEQEDLIAGENEQ